MHLRILTLLLLSTVYFKGVNAQCTTTINTFPYVEDFETSNGGWVSGGTANDWAWGTPSKSSITTAGSGTKCWVTGGLTGSFYKYGERSYVKSPCFDFTNLQHPYFAFLIYWESEHTYDGMVLQYSLDAGTTWHNVGASTDQPNCMTSNWYNTASVTNLNGLATPENGWTGNSHATSGNCQGTGGSLRWVRASHCMSELAGQPSVKFRFAFGAGTNCNDFDGIAFDSVSISEAPANTADFGYTCIASDKISFTGITTLCPDSFAWNFGDANSGNTNTASTLNATHTFSAPGDYSVTFTASGPCNAPATMVKLVHVLGVNNNVQNVPCYGDSTGLIGITASGGVLPYSYSWSDGNITPNRTGLAAGTYTVTVSDSLQCSFPLRITVTQPGQLLVSVITDSTNCGLNNGDAHVSATGGIRPYAFTWSPDVSDSASATALAAGNFVVTVTDSSGCVVSDQFTVGARANALPAPYLGKDTTICSGTSTLALNAGTYNSYLWQDSSTAQVFIVVDSGKYWVRVTGTNGCTASDTLVVTQKCDNRLVVPDAFSPNGDGKNDFFTAKTNDVPKKFVMHVYNRWGELVFESNSITNGWDGKFKGQPQPSGTYIYYIQYAFEDNVTHGIEGGFTLLR